MLDDLKGRRILIVEDNVTNMAVYAVTLKHLGAQVIQDPWNTDTLNTVKTHLPLDIILLDLMLRYQKSGYDIIEKLKADPLTSQIPVLAVSAADPESEMPRVKKSGFSGFIAKPIDPVKFPQQILACINGEKVWYAPYGWEDFA